MVQKGLRKFTARSRAAMLNMRLASGVTAAVYVVSIERYNLRINQIVDANLLHQSDR